MFEWLGERVKNLKNGSEDENSLSRKGMAPLESQYLAPLASSEAKGSLIVRDAAVAFGGVKAVDGVSFEIPAGG